MVKLRRSALALAVLSLLAVACDKTSRSVAEPASTPPTKAPPAASTTAAPSAAPPTTPTVERPLAEMPPSAETAPLAKANNTFAFALFDKVRSTPGNLALSPASIASALAMTYGGARGTTADEMKKAMRFTGDPAAVMAGWGKLQRALQSPDRPLTLRVANRLFGEKTYAFEKPYLEQTKAAFDAPLELMDFREAFDPARVRINGWVEEQTERRIKDLIPAGGLTADTRLVLVNAIYFLADWSQPFEKIATHDQDFTRATGSKKKVPMMHQGGSFRYAHTGGVSVLELPYKNEGAAMLVVLPDRVDGLAAVEASLDGAKLETWRAALRGQHVDVALPRFEIDPPAAIPLADTLIALGMPTAFDKEKADFTAIGNPADKRERLHIDKVFHKAFVKVDEKGTEAAAATAVVMAAGGGMPEKGIAFEADHPFLFVIMDRTTNLVLFVGRVAEP
jgi:serpin B